MAARVLIAANVLSAGVIAWYAFGKLGKRKRGLCELSNLVYSAMVGGAVAAAGHTLTEWQPHNLTEVLLNLAVAAYFARRMWQERQADKAVQTLPETEPKTETVNLEKENHNGNNSIEIERRTKSANAGKRCGKQHRKQHGSRCKRGNGRSRRH